MIIHMQLLKNMLLLNQGLPKFNLFNVNMVESTIGSLLENQHNQFLNLEYKLIQQFESLDTNELFSLAIHETEKIDQPLDFAWSVLSHLKSVKNNDEIREVYDKCIPEIIKEGSYVSQSLPLFNALKKLSTSGELSPVKQRIVDSSFKSMYLSGIDLMGDKKERFNEIKIRLSELSTKFSNNNLDYIADYELIVNSDNIHMKEMPMFALELYSQKAKNKYPESSPENGPWMVTLDAPSFIPFMKSYPNSDLREQIYRAYSSKASFGDKNNLPIIKEILELKKEISELLGFDNYVQISLEKKMAGSQKEIENLLNDLSKKSRDRAIDEINEIKNYQIFKEKSDNAVLNPWDISYYCEKIKEEKLGLKEEDLKPYFSLDNVLEGLFGVANNLFDIVIKESKGEVDVWDKDVKYFRIYNKGSDEEIASFYLDPYSRPGEKNGGAWMNNCVDKSKLMGTKPVAYLVCNGSPPINDGDVCKPSLMTFDEVVTLFHEFGHGLQHMLTTIDESAASGISNIEWDAVELPSQFMENWCYHKPTLKSFAKHYITNEDIPDDLFNKILDNKNFNSGLAMLRQIYFSMMDLHLYSHEMKSEEDILNVQKEFADRYLVSPRIEEDRFLCSFSHIFAGGYSAGYYSYKWAEIMSSDAFGLFEESDMNDKTKMNELGMKFRNTVLSLGGGTPPSDVFKSFRGREPQVDALLRHNGL